MVSGVRKIIWDKKAINQFKSAIEYIKQDSVKNAEKVKAELLKKIGYLQNTPEKYPLDKFKRNNDGSYRAFEKYRYRIAYRVLSSKVKIITIRHTSMEPLTY